MDSKTVKAIVDEINSTTDRERSDELCRKLLEECINLLQNREAIYHKYGSRAPWDGADKIYFALKPYIYGKNGNESIPLSFRHALLTGQIDVKLSWFDDKDEVLERQVFETRTAELQSEVERNKLELESSWRRLENHLKQKEQ